MMHDKIKLGKGELEHIHKNGLSLSIRDARGFFLDAVKEVKPVVLDDLAGEPFKLYKDAGLAFERERYVKEFADLELSARIRAIAPLESQHRWNHPRWLEHFENNIVDYNENTRAMQKSIFDWSMRHNLDANWCRARAYETLDWWYWFESYYENRLWNCETEMQPIPYGLNIVFNFSHKSLYPVFRTRSEEKELIIRNFEVELKSFLDERERIAKENGMVKPKRKREYLHFIWFAYSQVKEWTQPQIQNKFNASRRTVGEALDNIRNLLKTPYDPKSELTRPPSKVGRPRKN